MKSSLIALQRLCRTGKVLSRIFYVLSVVVAVIATVFLLLILLSSSLHDKVEKIVSSHSFYNIATLYGLSVVTVVLAIGEAIKAKKAENYFKLELEAGTPFKEELSKKMRGLGLAVIIVPIISYTISHVIYHILSASLSGMAPLELNASGSITLGVMFLVLSLITRYGAETVKGEES